MRREDGFTLVEMLVTMTVGLVVAFGAFALVDVSMSNSTRISSRVEANQLARPVLQRLTDELHSTCMGPEAAPVLPGSDADSVSFLHRTGAGVSPTPDLRVVSLTGSTLSESVYPAIGGSLPDWTFASTPSSTRQLLTGVGQALVDDPPRAVPLFQYFADDAAVGGQLSTEPLATPLTETDAARAVLLTVSFSVAPPGASMRDPGAAVSVSDSAYLRFSPFSENPSKVNGPCA